MELDRFTGYVRRCADDYGMLVPGDRVAVGVSGGKDSMALLAALTHLRRYHPSHFALEAITIDMGFPGMDFSPVAAWCAERGVPYTLVKTDIREIVSHEQALGQCADFIKSLGDVRVTVCSNTAEAARAAAESGRNDIAALASPDCASLYGLSVLKTSVQNSDNNHTRFICISKDIEVYPGANRISLMLTLPHRPGSLYRMMARFAALGLNLTKLESRPIEGLDFEFMFYFDIEADVCAAPVLGLLGDLDRAPETFNFLGAYSEL